VLGRIVSHYRIVSELGSGGMGVVYEAEDNRLGRHVALKLLPSETGRDAPTMERFLREARIVSTLSHPHICTLHDIGEHDGQQFMVMELLEGEVLRSRIARGPIAVPDLLDLGAQIADALDAAHGAGVIHRDIKPANLFITRRGQAKVLDFGVAKLAQTGSPSDLASTIGRSDLTMAGSAVGTVAYMSPEQARGQEIDARSDLFSFGLVLYEMATGQPAFSGPTSAVIFEGILTRTPHPPSHLNANLPAELDHIVGKALERDRETRYQTAAEMRADLKRLKREIESGFASTTATSPSAAVSPVRESSPPAPAISSAVGPDPARTGSKTRRALLIGAPVVTLVVIAGALLWQSQRVPALAARDTVVLADFRNRTGDAMFDDTLSEALAVQLRQSPFLRPIPEQQVQATLQLMGKQPNDALTPEVAQQVCQRTGAKATLGGTIASLGSSYVLTLSAQDCVSSEILAEEQVEARAKEGVITALGQAASRFREQLGESLAMVQRYDQNIEMATTPSLEALKAYSQGMTTRRTQGDFESLPFFRRAIELDPNFALAHARLGTVLVNLNERADAIHSATRAFELRDKVSERERLYIEARYHTAVTRDTAKAIEAYRLLLSTYPDDYAANTNIGSLYRVQGKLTEAIQHLKEAVRLAPNQPIGRGNLGSAYLFEGRFAEARQEFEQVLKLQESPTARNGLFVLATLTGDQALAAAQIAAVAGRRAEADLLGIRVLAAGYKGQMREAERLANDLFERLRATNRLAFMGEAFVTFAIAQASVGRTDAARAGFDRVVRNNLIIDGTADEVVALAAILGDTKLVRTYMERAVAHTRLVAAPEKADSTERGIRAFEPHAARRYEEASTLASLAASSDPANFNAVFIAGYAALHLKRWDEATSAFDTMIRQRNKIGMSPAIAICHIMAARAHAGAGRVEDARKRYQEAFTLWKDADADLPLLVQARQEFARLGT
jgi:serine/threonine protein kinase/tetratricopeptide (TPR) repeat protein